MRDHDLSKAEPDSQTWRDRRVRRVILIEGALNAAVLLLKLLVGLSTGSLAILGDALHSLGDVLNNGMAWIVVRASARPADREHPYGHRKFETLAVFTLAALLVVLGVELALGALRREPQPIASKNWELAVMIAVLVGNLALTTWENAWAKRLDSSILAADARHTLADVLTTVLVIVSWQIAARGYPGVDTACALFVALLVLVLAFGLFRKAVPILVDHIAVPPETLAELARSVPGVLDVKTVRSRSKGDSAAVDMVVTVAPNLSTEAAHRIVDEIEGKLRSGLGVEDATIHVEPGPSARG